MSKPTLIDIFCGAGGFSEGFRQQGFEIVMGVDYWEPAIKTFNHNFQLNCPVKNVTIFETSTEEIEKLPDTDLIIGSPPCVTFSNSNRSGNADKSKGIGLIEIFLRIVAVKKHKPNSKLKVWLMENVVNSIKYLKKEYTFNDLNLTKWAKQNNINPTEIAITLKDNQHIINSADYGSPQIRKRAISGEFVKRGILILPPRSHKSSEEEGNLPNYVTLSKIKAILPKPNLSLSSFLVSDPLYPSIKIKSYDLTDHFYDSGLYECEWRWSRFWKTNHPFMGKMFFPENENRPSRTVTATMIGTSREAIIYKSEYNRKGNGEYRMPTIRETASIMGFPITYQFVGSESAKCRLVGNAVCPSVSRAFAKLVRSEMRLQEQKELNIILNPDLNNVLNLNTFSKKEFNSPPEKKVGSRFRMQPFKEGNLTVTLSNYDIISNKRKRGKWLTSVQYGTGKGFPSQRFADKYYLKIEEIIESFEGGKRFIEKINNGFSEKIADAKFLQEMYETQKSKGQFLEPTELIDKVVLMIEEIKFDNPIYVQEKRKIIKAKQAIPKKQIMALYAINKITTVANGKMYE